MSLPESNAIAPELLLFVEPQSPDCEARIRLGRDKAKASSVTVLALARNLGDRLRPHLHTVELLVSMFGKHQICVYENDSTDDTAQQLRLWADQDPDVRHCWSETLQWEKWGSVRSPVRGDHMAHYRNRNRDLMLATCDPADYVLVLDLDIGQYSQAGLAHSLSHEFDMMGSNGLFFSKGRYIQNDVWAWRRLGDPTPLKFEDVHPIVPKVGDPLIPLLSCFGGMGLYRYAAYISAPYQGGDCEHVPFHQGLSQNGYGRIYMNPSQVVLYS